MQANKIVFIHSLNNYTGSPNVFSVIIRGFIKRGYQAELFTSRGDGFLSDISGVKYRYTCYHWSRSQATTLIRLLLSQSGLFFRVLFYSRKHIYYINTIVPFGAILACWLTGKRFVIHVHENMQQRKPIYKIFRTIYRWCNTKSIFVSQYLKSTATNCRGGQVIYNALPQTYFDIAGKFLREETKHNSSILMVASLRRFKGVYEFAELAKQMPQYNFELVLATDEKEVRIFEVEINKPDNLTVYSQQTNLHPFYQRARLLLQLSHPESCVETFGLTILEAMVYGVPAIVPDIGGPTELITNNENGYTVNPHDLDLIVGKIEGLIQDEELYGQFSRAALLKSNHFNESKMIDSIEKYITKND